MILCFIDGHCLIGGCLGAGFQYNLKQKHWPDTDVIAQSIELMPRFESLPKSRECVDGASETRIPLATVIDSRTKSPASSNCRAEHPLVLVHMAIEQEVKMPNLTRPIRPTMRPDVSFGLVALFENYIDFSLLFIKAWRSKK